MINCDSGSISLLYEEKQDNKKKKQYLPSLMHNLVSAFGIFYFAFMPDYRQTVGFCFLCILYKRGRERDRQRQRERDRERERS